MGHVGVTPRSGTMLGGFKARGRTAGRAIRLVADSLAHERAGCFSVVLEAVPPPVAAQITRELSIPTIGIGARADCDGQVLVYHDLLGYQEGGPRFVKQYAQLGPEIQAALARYAEEVRSGAFPDERHTYAMPDEELAEFEASLVQSGGQD